MDEHNGYFRVATTEWGVGTAVTVFDREMKRAGRTPWLEPNETMQSMRFMGDMGYVVTFENTDPLFTVDLSDPYDPRVLGELKIPGFSQYLHPVGDGWLLGIGRDTEELTDNRGNVTGFRDTGMKVSLFDVRDPHNPKEAAVLPLGEGWAEVSHNPRALMADNRRGLYGFTAESWSWRGNDSRYRFTAFAVKVEDGALSLAAELDIGNGEYRYGAWNSRLAYIGGTMYVLHQGGIEVYDYGNFTKIGSLAY
jgi:uncharacterized secreted protein with C-terminal beta-propeller domain